jgi:multidrug efflux pump subunit AcrA (membrane-fusion protein)
VGTVVEAVYGIGTVTVRQSFQLKIGVVLTIRHFYVREGDKVNKGDLLVSFDDNPPIVAPFAGVITSLPFREGETVFQQLPILVLEDMDHPYVVVSLEQTGVMRVKPGQNVKLSFESIRNQPLFGKVVSVYPKDGQFFVNIEVPEIPPGILKGMTADVAIEVANKENVILVPIVAIDHGKLTVIRNGLPQKVNVKIGAMNGLDAEILDNAIGTNDLIVLPVGKKAN